MQPSSSYPYGDPPAQLSSYATPIQRSQNTTASLSTTNQISNRSPYDELRTPHYSQQHHTRTPSGLHPGDGAVYVPVPRPPQPSHHVHANAPYHSHSPDAGYKQSSGEQRSSYPGYLFEAPYSDSAQFSTPSQPIIQDVNRHHFLPTPSEIARAYPSYPSDARPILPSRHTFQPASHRVSQSHPSAIPEVTSVGSTPNMSAAISAPTERYPCEKCGKTFSRYVGG